MQYRNVLFIFANVFFISSNYANHIGQDSGDTHPTKVKKNDGNYTTLKERAREKNKEKMVHFDIFKRNGDRNDEETEPNELNASYKKGRHKMSQNKSSCWMTLDTEAFFKVLDTIDDLYAADRKAVQDAVVNNNFEAEMLQTMLSSGGAVVRPLYSIQDQRNKIPAGMNLGGYCMMKMPDSILFFHRVKLRNETVFRINFLLNDLANMVLITRISLHDLHLRGAFERSVTTDVDPSTLFYAPSFGEVDFLLKNVEYKMEGRYRLIAGRLVIEVIISEITVGEVLMTYINDALENPPIRLKSENIAEFVERIKTDLDNWLKDYFNDYLIYTDLSELGNLDKLADYDKEKSTAVNLFFDDVLDKIRKRIRDKKAMALRVPKFTIIGADGFKINLHSGIFCGLDSIFRRSVATTRRSEEVGMVDAIVGFSDLSVTYEYDAQIPNGLPPLMGKFTLPANELTARISLTMVKQPETVNIDIDNLEWKRHEPSFSVQGAANIHIGSFRHLLEHQIMTLMTNGLIYGTKTLRSLPKCEPYLPGQIHKELATDAGMRKFRQKSKKNINPEEDSSALRSEKKNIRDHKKPNKKMGSKRKSRNKF